MSRELGLLPIPDPFPLALNSFLQGNSDSICCTVYISIPKHFPHHGKASYVAPTLRQKFSSTSLARIDIFGAIFLLGATLLFVTVLLEAGTSFSWSSGTSISLLVVSAVLWILFVINERVVTSDKWRPEPVFPWRFFFSRAWMGTLLYV